MNDETLSDAEVLNLETKARAEGFRFLARLIHDPAQLRKHGFASLEDALSYEEKRITRLETRVLEAWTHPPTPAPVLEEAEVLRKRLDAAEKTRDVHAEASARNRARIAELEAEIAALKSA